MSRSGKRVRAAVRRALMVCLILPGVACAPDPSSAPLPVGSPPDRAFAYVLEPDGIHVHAVEASTATFSFLEVVPASNPAYLALHPSGRFLFVVACEAHKNCDAEAYAIDPGSGRLTLVDHAESTSGIPRMATAATPNLYVLVDDSSTGYAAYIDAFAINGATGGLRIPDRVLGRVGSYLSVPRLDSMELDSAGRFLWEVSSGPRPRIVTYTIEDTGGLRLVGEVDVPVAAAAPNLALEAAAHSSGRFVYAVGGDLVAGRSSLLAYQVAESSGLLSLVGRTEAAPVARSPRLLALDPHGRFLYVLTSSGPASYRIDGASGALQAVGQAPGRGRRGYLALEPAGRFLYLSDDATREVWAYAIDQESGSLSEIGRVSSGGGDLVILRR